MTTTKKKPTTTKTTSSKTFLIHGYAEAGKSFEEKRLQSNKTAEDIAQGMREDGYDSVIIVEQ